MSRSEATTTKPYSVHGLDTETIKAIRVLAAQRELSHAEVIKAAVAALSNERVK